jgi:hypothetical protein
MSPAIRTADVAKEATNAELLSNFPDIRSGLLADDRLL